MGQARKGTPFFIPKSGKAVAVGRALLSGLLVKKQAEIKKEEAKQAFALKKELIEFEAEVKGDQDRRTKTLANFFARKKLEREQEFDTPGEQQDIATSKAQEKSALASAAKATEETKFIEKEFGLDKEQQVEVARHNKATEEYQSALVAAEKDRSDTSKREFTINKQIQLIEMTFNAKAAISLEEYKNQWKALSSGEGDMSVVERQFRMKQMELGLGALAIATQTDDPKIQRQMIAVWENFYVPVAVDTAKLTGVPYKKLDVDWDRNPILGVPTSLRKQLSISSGADLSDNARQAISDMQSSGVEMPTTQKDLNTLKEKYQLTDKDLIQMSQGNLAAQKEPAVSAKTLPQKPTIDDEDINKLMRILKSEVKSIDNKELQSATDDLDEALEGLQ